VHPSEIQAIMQCAISGETPEEPVVSVKSGHVFEKRLILNYLESGNGRCPVTDEPLTLDDLIPLKANKIVKPRPTTATSIPSMLALFQNEWDSLMLETYSLKEQLENIRQELSEALYQHDAACRVIARLMKERDEARSALEHFKATNKVSGQTPAPRSGGDSMEVEAGLTEEMKNRIKAKAQELSKERKSRKIPEELATADGLAKYTMISTNNTHKAKEPGITCIDVHPGGPNKVLTGGIDKQVILFNRGTGKIAASMSDHSEEVTDVMFHPSQDIYFSTSKDKTAKVWRDSDNDISVAHTVQVHNDDVVGCSLHATGDFWITASADQHWAFHDLATSSTLAQIDAGSACHSIHFHPDGLLVGTGQSTGQLKIWDIKVLKNVANFDTPGGQVNALEFSENG